MNSSKGTGDLERATASSSSTSPQFFGPLSQLIGDYGQRLISSPPECRDAVLMELTAKWFEHYVRKAYEKIETEADCITFHGRLDNLFPWFWNDLGPVLAESDKDIVNRAIAALIQFWRGRAWLKVSPTTVPLTVSEPSKTAIPQPQGVAFPGRASWLRRRLLERGWGTADPSEYGGPDRKTIQKILRGESVRNEVLEKLANALSKRHAKLTVLDIPQN